MAIILIASLIYIIIISSIFISVKRIFLNLPNKSGSNVKISVVVAAKNEAHNLPSLINSLKEQSYPKELFEAIIVDDNSTDETFDKAKSLSSGLNNFSVYKAERKKYPGKKGALQFGIEKANNPFILITDADCQPEKKWVESFAGKFLSGSEFIFGAAPFIQNMCIPALPARFALAKARRAGRHPLGKSMINKISCFENLRTSVLTFSAASFGFPYSAAARSFGFSRSSFEKLSGYKNTTETLSGDDDLLLREAVKNKMKIDFTDAAASFVYSNTVTSFSDYLKQKARHTSTSPHYLFVHKLLLGFWHLLNLVMLFSPLLIPLSNNFLILFFVKIAGDIFLVSSVKKYFNYRFNFLEIVFLQIVYEIFLIINFFNAIFRKAEWK